MKNLQKVFLLVALFFGGCSTTTETNTTPSDALIDLIGGKRGHFVESPYYYCFYITDDGTKYIDAIDGIAYKYTGGSDNSATYETTISGYTYKFVLSNISASEGGDITLSWNGIPYIDTTFAWGTYSSTSAVSSVSYSSAIQALSQQ